MSFIYNAAHLNQYTNLEANKSTQDSNQINDYGQKPIIFHLDDVSEINQNFRTTLWTGTYLQLTLMSLNVREDIGAEMHPDVDQLLYIVNGEALVLVGNREDNLYFQEKITEEIAVIIPAGTWHNIINIGASQLKLFSIYAPPQHSFGTVHETRKEGSHS